MCDLVEGVWVGDYEDAATSNKHWADNVVLEAMKTVEGVWVGGWCWGVGGCTIVIVEIRAPLWMTSGALQAATQS